MRPEARDAAESAQALTVYFFSVAYTTKWTPVILAAATFEAACAAAELTVHQSLCGSCEATIQRARRYFDKAQPLLLAPQSDLRRREVYLKAFVPFLETADYLL